MNTPETSLELVQAWTRAINAETQDLVGGLKNMVKEYERISNDYYELWSERNALLTDYLKYKERFERVEEGRDESHEILTLAGVPEFDENGGKRKVADRIMDLWKTRHPWLS